MRLLFAVMRKIVLEIPALFILNYLFPLYGLAYAQCTAEIVLSVCAVLISAAYLQEIRECLEIIFPRSAVFTVLSAHFCREYADFSVLHFPGEVL